MLAERGIVVVVSAGNTGPGWNTMNPYAVAPWVVGVGATDGPRRLATFSSRGQFASAVFRPKLVAPGARVTGLRTASAPSVTGVFGVETDLTRFTPSELPYYTTASGTSFSAPQVAGAVALMLEVNPALTPGEVLEILQRTATPLPAYYQHEVGAGMLNAHAAALEAAFGRHTGEFRAVVDRGQALFSEATTEIAGTVAPHGAVEVAFPVPAGTIQASVQVAWGPLLTTNDLALDLVDGAGVRRASSNALNLPGLTGRREAITLGSPTAGTWRARVRHAVNLLATPQTIKGFAQVVRVEYAPVQDLAGLPAGQQDEIRRAIRSYVMLPLGSKFRPEWSVTRAELAETMVRAGRAPQYLAGAAVYSDVRDRGTRLWVESAGGLFPDSDAGFDARTTATRLVAAVVLVRAAGLGAEAEARSGDALAGVLDASSIPAAYRGYVALALERGLLTLRGGTFRPSDPLTRVDLAHAAVVLMQ
jgi:serine protease AprX